MKILLLVLAVLATSVATAQEDERDPLGGLNRVTQKFNDKADSLVLKPVARAYKAVVPGFARIGVSNFFSNLGDVNSSANNLLQGKVGDGLTDLLRILLNSTIGLGGFFDPASGLGLRKHEEDFGQTLSVWGVPRGPYLVIPLLGPSTLTDALGRPVSSRLNPYRYYDPIHHRNVLYGVDLIDTRAGLLAVERAIFGDRYVFLREAYLQRREYLISDGKVEDSF